ncbi:MAG: hypothetical protein KBC38_00135 [Candidatus Pacebacteria bacterium]|nr:hypothetical protein [Candidatus Paceibacterota bacterium]MBP9840411.1 hypothetical protein [Candidatus Paceibacterota bacterium]
MDGEEVIVVGQKGTFASMVYKFTGFIDSSIIPLLFAAAFLAMLVGIFRYFMIPGEENLQKGRQFLLWGGIAFVFMFLIWGLVNLLLDSVF